MIENKLGQTIDVKYSWASADFIPEVIRLIANFTVTSLQHWEFAPNSVTLCAISTSSCANMIENKLGQTIDVKYSWASADDCGKAKRTF